MSAFQNPANWGVNDNVHDGSLVEQSFSGSTVSGASVNTILFFNNDPSVAGDLTLNSTLVTRVPGVDKLVVGELVRGSGIADGTYITAIDVVNDTITLSQAATQGGSATTLYVFDKTSVSGDATSGSTMILNISDPRLQVGMKITGPGIPDGTTISYVSLVGKFIYLSNSVTQGGTGVEFYPDSEAFTQTPLALDSSTIAITDTLTLAGGAILQATHAGLHQNSIVGGVLTSGLANTDGTTADLIIYNYNPLTALNISSQIADNADSGLAVNLVLSGDGTTALSGTNTYTGTTYLQGGVLRLDSAGALSASSHLRLDGGVLGLNFGDFSLGLGSGAGQIEWASSGGFAAYTTNRTVNIGGSGGTLTWGSNGFVPDNDSLELGAQDADKTLIFANGIDLGSKDRLVEVVSGIGAVYSSTASYPGPPFPLSPDATLAGMITGSTGRLIKGGNGVLELAGFNTYAGGTSLAEGTLVVDQNNSLGSNGLVEIGTTTDTRSSGMALTLVFNGNTLSNSLKFGNVNSAGISVLSTPGSSPTTVTGNMEVARTAGHNVLLTAGAYSTVNYEGVISGLGGITVVGGNKVELSGANSYGAQTGGTGAAISGGTVLRNGTLVLSNPTSLGQTSTLELGDATYTKLMADYATNGASLLGAESNTAITVTHVSGLGGAFLATGGGLYFGGLPNAGSGAFYNVSRTVDGVTLGTADVGKTILVKDEIDHPERNGLYVVTQFNDDLTMNLTRVTGFDSTANMLYGTQVGVNNGTLANQTFFMAAPSVTTINGVGTDPVYWLQDQSNPTVTLLINSAAITSITQDIDINANGSGVTAISSATPVAFTGNVTLQDLGPGTVENKTLTITSTAIPGTEMVFSGAISEASGSEDKLGLNMNGSGVVTLTGNNTYHGGTTVANGTLLVNNVAGSGTGYGDVNVQYGTTLGGSGFLAPGAGHDITISNGATLLVGTPGSTSAQSLSVALQSSGGTPDTQSIFTLSSGSTLQLDLYLNLGTTPSNESDRLVFSNGGGTSSIAIDGATLHVGIGASSALDPSSFHAGDTWQLIDWGGLTPTGTFAFTDLNGSYTADFTDLPDLGAGRFWDISQLYTTGNIIVAVPEPGRWLLLLLGFLALGWQRRRCRVVV